MSERFPEDFPPMTLAAQRALCAVSQKSPEKLVPALDSLYRAFWVDGNSKTANPDVFIPILERVLGKGETQEIIQAVCQIHTIPIEFVLIKWQSSQPDVKSLLGANTDRAFKSGAFGLPWFECTNSRGQTEGFWGIDHLGQVADFLGLDRSADKGFRAVL